MKPLRTALFPLRVRTSISVLLAVTLVTRLAYLVARWKTLTGGGMEYELLADSFLSRGSFFYTYFSTPFVSAYMPPGTTFVILLAKILFPAAPYFFIAAVQLTLAVGTLLLVARIAERSQGPRVSLWAAAFYAFDLNLFIPMAWINETIYTMFLLALSVHLVGRLDDEPSPSLAAGLGIVMGIGSLFRSTLLPQFGLALLWLLASRRRGRRPFPLKTLGVAALFFALTLTPWTVRNYKAFGKIIPVSQNLGINLWCGWNPQASGSEYGSNGRWMTLEPALKEKLENAKSEPEINALYMKAAFGYALKNPLRWMKQRLLSFLFFWHEHNFWSAKNPFHTPAWRIVGLLNIPFLLLFFVSAAGTAKMNGVPRYLLLVMGLHCLIYTLIHADIGSRFRYQIEPLMLITISTFLFARRPALGDRLERWVRFLVIAPGQKFLQKSVGDYK